MPRKRRAGLRGLAEGLSGGAADVLALLLQSKLIGDRQAETQQATLTGQMLNDVRTELAKLDPTFVRTYGPQAAEAQYETAISRVPAPMRPLLGQRPDFRVLDTPYPERLGALTQEISGITNPDDLRLTREGIRKRAPGFRVTPDLAIPNLLPGSGGGDSGARVEDPNFAALVKAAEGQRAGLLSAEGFEPIEDYSSGVKTVRRVPTRDAIGITSQGERTTEQQAERDGAIRTAAEQASLDVQNDPANQAATARGAALTADAEARARLATELDQMGITGQQQQAALALADDFEQRSTDYFAREQAYQTIEALATEDSATGDLGLIFSVMKMFDPGSVVREGEFATAQNAAGIPTRVRNMYNRALTGERLQPEQRTEFARTARAIYQRARKDHAERIETYGARADQMQVPRSLVIREMGPNPSIVDRLLRERGGS